MAEGRASSARQGRIAIRNPQDFYGGLALIAVGLVALWVLRTLPGMQGLRFGPGTAPRLFAGLLAVVGVAVTVIGLLAKGSTDLRYAIREPLLVMAAVLIFAGGIKPLGLVIPTFITILVAASASVETRWRETVIWAIVLTLFCAVLFPYALKVPLSLWPRF